MGIGGLLPLLKEIQQPAHVRDWAGKTVAVDGYVWLHRGAYGCAEDLALERPTVKYVNYAMHRVRMLKHFGVTPVLVFDGGLLPSKMGTEDAREAKRADALARGRAFLAEGKGAQARECFVKAVDVTPAMAFQLIKALRREGVQYVVAPYEADPQLAYLERTGLVDAVVTEDSDLLVFGCRNVLFKLDGEGNCVSISRNDFARCREYNFAGWSETEFRQMAILSGCDYLDSIVGLGLKTAYRLLRKYKTPEKVIQFIRLEGQLTVPRTYLDEFRRAEKTFLHQHVFDPVKRELTHLTPLPEGVTADDLPFIGPLLDGDFARGIADGLIDPLTKLEMVDLVPDSRPSTSAPFKPQPFKRTTASTGKPAAGSLLSYFSRAPAASTSTAPTNPAKTAKARAKVVLVDGASFKGKGKGKEAGAEARTSKFFGGAAASKPDTKGKGKARADERTIDEGEDMLDAAAAEDSGFLEGLELSPCSDDLDAEEAMREGELSTSVEMHVPITNVGDDGDGRLAAAEDDTLAAGEGSQSPECAASPLPSSPAISSPLATPPRRRVKLSQSPLADVGIAPALPPSDAGISSPAQSTVAQAGWDNDELSSPVAVAVAVAATVIKPEPAPRPAAVKKEQADAPTPTIELSSDPIVLSSSPGVSPPRASLSREVKPLRKPKAPARSSQGKTKSSPRRSKDVSVEVLADAGPSSSSSSTSVKKKRKGSEKKRKKAQREEEDEEDEGKDEAAKALAASWRAKFMMPIGYKTPLGRTTAGRPVPVTPSTTDRPPSNELKPAAAPSTARPAKRPPLSPKSDNRTSAGPPPRKGSPLKRQRAQHSSQEDVEPDLAEEGAVPRPAAKKRRAHSGMPVPSSSEGILLTSDAAQGESSSSPVVVTNPRLLAFRFTGSVRRE